MLVASALEQALQEEVPLLSNIELVGELVLALEQ